LLFDAYKIELGAFPWDDFNLTNFYLRCLVWIKCIWCHDLIRICNFSLFNIVAYWQFTLVHCL